MRRIVLSTAVLATVVALVLGASAPSFAAPDRNIGVNVLLNRPVSNQILQRLGTYGRVQNVFYELDALTMRAKESRLPAIRQLPFVEAANPDEKRLGRPIDTVSADNFADGDSTWDQDAVNVTDTFTGLRTIGYDGSGVYVAVLDTGLLDSWRRYFPQERIAEEYGIAFGGGGVDRGFVSSQPNKWEHDQDSHGTHVTSTILGYDFRGDPTNGTAPMATVIPVKVLGNAGWGWSSVIAMGILYVTDLAEGPLSGHPMVINMSLGGSRLDAVEQAAIDYAISKGVVIVASAGNRGDRGMSYPGAYPPVISAAASGWTGEWVQHPGCPSVGSWWWCGDVADPTAAGDFYITDFSSRALAGQDLDVAAPGSWVVGPYQLQSGWTSYYYLGGTSMASPHVAGIVALMLEKNPGLTAADAESILETTAIAMPAGCLTVMQPWGPWEYCWDTDATGWGLVDAEAALAATP